jgi:hypothetical protein
MPGSNVDTSKPEKGLSRDVGGKGELFPADLKNVIEFSELFDRVMDFGSTQLIVDVRSPTEYVIVL